MYKSAIVYGILIGLLAVSFSCMRITKPGENLLAQVGDKKLYQSDLEVLIAKGTNKYDSAIIADDYINKWAKQELLLLKANENLSPEEKNVNRQLEEYRNSLLIYKYKNALLKQKMDTVVTRQQIEDYYNNHQENFYLNKNIVKAIFIKIPTEVANPSYLKQLIENSGDEELNELREYCLQYAKKFDIFTDKWVDFEIIENNIPDEITDENRFLKGNSLHELNDSNYYYLVSIQDYKLKNQIAPIDYVENNIANLILNKRKIAFLKEIDENVYKEGVRQNKIKIFTKNEIN